MPAVPVAVPGPPCLLQATKSRKIRLGHQLRPDWEVIKAITWTSTALGGLVGLGFCAAECDDPLDTVSKVGLVGVAVVLLYPLAVISGLGR